MKMPPLHIKEIVIIAIQPMNSEHADKIVEHYKPYGWRLEGGQLILLKPQINFSPVTSGQQDARVKLKAV